MLCKCKGCSVSHVWSYFDDFLRLKASAWKFFWLMVARLEARLLHGSLMDSRLLRLAARPARLLIILKDKNRVGVRPKRTAV